MAHLIEKHQYFIEFILNTSENQVAIIFNNIEKEQLRFLSEVAYNFLKGTFSISHEQLEHIKRYRNILRKFSLKTSSLKSRRNILNKNKRLVKLFKYKILPALKSYLSQ